MEEAEMVGVGMHRFGRFENKSYIDMGLEAAVGALKDAKVDWKQVNAAYCSTMYLPATSGVRILTQLGRTGAPIADVESACASGGIALRQAAMAIATGDCDIALALGVEKMPRGFLDPRMLYDEWQIQTGLSMNPMYWGLNARRHMEMYGTTDEQIARVAFKNHRNSVHNPYAMYQKAFTMEEILNSPMVNAPLRLYEVCAPNEGAAAVVIASKKAARKLTDKPISILACVHKVGLYPHWGPPCYQFSTSSKNPSRTKYTVVAAYDKSGVGPKDLDLVETQDTCAFHELDYYEQLGLCGEGEAAKLISEGATEINGRIPVNASGGLISKGEPIGASHLGQIAEIVWQLRGQAGPRQVKDPHIGLAHVTGAGGNCCITILKN